MGVESTDLDYSDIEYAEQTEDGYVGLGIQPMQ